MKHWRKRPNGQSTSSRTPLQAIFEATLKAPPAQEA
jgi:hypothetical protein